jgi:hypothetical protein
LPTSNQTRREDRHGDRRALCDLGPIIAGDKTACVSADAFDRQHRRASGARDGPRGFCTADAGRGRTLPGRGGAMLANGWSASRTDWSNRLAFVWTP